MPHRTALQIQSIAAETADVRRALCAGLPGILFMVLFALWKTSGVFSVRIFYWCLPRPEQLIEYLGELLAIKPCCTSGLARYEIDTDKVARSMYPKYGIERSSRAPPPSSPSSMPRGFSAGGRGGRRMARPTGWRIGSGVPFRSLGLIPSWFLCHVQTWIGGREIMFSNPSGPWEFRRGVLSRLPCFLVLGDLAK